MAACRTQLNISKIILCSNGKRQTLTSLYCAENKFISAPDFTESKMKATFFRAAKNSANIKVLIE